MALVNVMSMFSQMASPVFVYSVGVQSPPQRLLYSQTLQSVVSEGAPFLLIALVCLLASIPGKKKCSKRLTEGWIDYDLIIWVHRTLSSRNSWGESS